MKHMNGPRSQEEPCLLQCRENFIKDFIIMDPLKPISNIKYKLFGYEITWYLPRVCDMFFNWLESTVTHLNKTKVRLRSKGLRNNDPHDSKKNVCMS